MENMSVLLRFCYIFITICSQFGAIRRRRREEVDAVCWKRLKNGGRKDVFVAERRQFHFSCRRDSLYIGSMQLSIKPVLGLLRDVLMLLRGLAMEIHVYDTYVKAKDGHTMHFRCIYCGQGRSESNRICEAVVEHQSAKTMRR